MLDATDQALATQLDVYFDGGDFPRTIELLRARYEMNPTNYERATDLGWMLENIEKWDQAICHLRPISTRSHVRPEPCPSRS